jgi:hypothetical protein
MAPGTNRRVLSAGDELCIQEIVKKAHEEQYVICGLTFARKITFNAITIFTIIIGSFTITGGIVFWAMQIQSSVSVLTATADKHNSDLIEKKSKDVAERDSIIKENAAAFKELLKRTEPKLK